LVQNLNFLIFQSWIERWERKLLNSSDGKKKPQLTSILATTNVDFGVSRLYSTTEVYPRSFFVLHLAWDDKFKLRKRFGFRLISIFSSFLSYLGSWIGLSGCVKCFLGVLDEKQVESSLLDKKPLAWISDNLLVTWNQVVCHSHVACLFFFKKIRDKPPRNKQKNKLNSSAQEARRPWLF
jgi:hypothetical protein